MIELSLRHLEEDIARGMSDKLKSYLAAMARFHRYSLANQVLIACQRPDATNVAGFHAWRRFGRLVKKGETGIAIMAPVIRTWGEVEEDRGDGTTQRSVIRKVVNVKPVYVFDVSQTEGEPLPRFADVTGDPSLWMPKLKQFFTSKGIELIYAVNLAGALGCSSGGSVSVLAGLDPAEEFRVLVHELGHELLHKGDRRQHTSRKVRETEAEAVAYVVCRAVGLDCSTSSSDYIQLYDGDRATLAGSLTAIRNVSSELLTALKETVG